MFPKLELDELHELAHLTLDEQKELNELPMFSTLEVEATAHLHMF